MRTSPAPEPVVAQESRARALDGLTAAIFEASHAASLPDDASGMEMARLQANQWVSAYLDELGMTIAEEKG